MNIENGDGTLPKPGDILDPFAYGMYPVEDVEMPVSVKEGYALPYMPEKSFEEQAAEYMHIIKAHKEENYVKQCANGMIYLFSRLDQLDSLEAKKAAMAMFDSIRINSYSLSYTGRLDLVECEKYIESMHLKRC